MSLRQNRPVATARPRVLQASLRVLPPRTGRVIISNVLQASAAWASAVAFALQARLLGPGAAAFEVLGLAGWAARLRLRASVAVETAATLQVAYQMRWRIVENLTATATAVIAPRLRLRIQFPLLYAVTSFGAISRMRLRTASALAAVTTVTVNALVRAGGAGADWFMLTTLGAAARLRVRTSGAFAAAGSFTVSVLSRLRGSLAWSAPVAFVVTPLLRLRQAPAWSMAGSFSPSPRLRLRGSKVLSASVTFIATGSVAAANSLVDHLGDTVIDSSGNTVTYA